MESEYDFILVGGGLQNGLLALLLTRLQPAARVYIVSQQSAWAAIAYADYQSQEVSA